MSEICKFHAVVIARRGLEQFKDGLRTLNILLLMKTHPAEFRELFCHSTTALNADTIEKLFVPKYAEEGTRIREKQEHVIMHWRDYLQECEGL